MYLVLSPFALPTVTSSANSERHRSGRPSTITANTNGFISRQCMQVAKYFIPGEVILRPAENPHPFTNMRNKLQYESIINFQRVDSYAPGRNAENVFSESNPKRERYLNDTFVIEKKS